MRAIQAFHDDPGAALARATSATTRPERLEADLEAWDALDAGAGAIAAALLTLSRIGVAVYIGTTSPRPGESAVLLR